MYAANRTSFCAELIVVRDLFLTPLFCFFDPGLDNGGKAEDACASAASDDHTKGIVPAAAVDDVVNDPDDVDCDEADGVWNGCDDDQCVVLFPLTRTKIASFCLII